MDGMKYCSKDIIYVLFCSIMIKKKSVFLHMYVICGSGKLEEQPP